jgi:curved DNA-binding protein CbpA
MGESEEIHAALETLGLPPMVTREEIKRRYRQLAYRHHPDRGAEDTARMAEINRAYERLMEYVENFRFRFDEEEIARQVPGGHHHEKFKP